MAGRCVRASARAASRDATGSIPTGFVYLCQQALPLVVIAAHVQRSSGVRNHSLLSAGSHRNRRLAFPAEVYSMGVQSHLPSVFACLRYGDVLKTFCTLTRWNVLSYRHCCRGIATVTRSVARCGLFLAWQPSTDSSSAANSQAPVGEARDDLHRLAPSERHLQSSLKPRPTVDYTEFGIRRLACVNLGWLSGQTRRCCGSGSCDGDR